MDHFEFEEEKSIEDVEEGPFFRGTATSLDFDESDSLNDSQEISAPRSQIVKNATANAKIAIPVTLLIIANVIYYLSLESCPEKEGEETCIIFLKNKIGEWITEVFASSICIFIVLKFCSRLWKVIAILNIILFFLRNSDFSIYDHGGVSKIVLIIGILICYAIYGMCKLVFNCYKRNKRLLLCSIASMLISAILLSSFFVAGSCNNWEYGIGGRKLINDGQHCTVPIPTYCELGMRREVFNVNLFARECNEIEIKFGMTYASPELQARDNVTRVGMPRDENIPSMYRTDRGMYRDYVRAHMFDMDDPSVPQSVKDNTEFVIDMTDPDHHKLIVEVKHNKTRAAEQKQLRDEILEKEKQEGTYDTRIDTNVLMFYIDDISRAHFMRKLPKTTAWLDKFTTEEYPDNDVYQFFRYHSVHYNTRASNSAMFYGQIGRAAKHSTYNMFQTYSDNGYVTGYFNDGCEQMPLMFAKEDPALYSFDHFAGGITCEGYYGESKSDSELFFTDGKYSMFRRCRYGKQMHQIQIDYLSKFWEAYPDNKKFFQTDFSEAHELTGNLISFMDEDIVSFFEKFYERGHMDDTTVLFVSDHGAHAYTIHIQLFPDNSRSIENYLATMFIIMPTSIPDNVKATLAKNEQAFIDSFDFFSTFSTLANNKQIKTKYADSRDFFHEEIPDDADCDDKKGFSKCWCMNDEDAVMDQFHENWLFYMSF